MEKIAKTLLEQEAEVGQRLMMACTDAGCPIGVNMVDWIKKIASIADSASVLFDAAKWAENYLDTFAEPSALPVHQALMAAISTYSSRNQP